MKTVFLLLIIYQIKHFIADFPLQNSYMLGKFKKYPDYIIPLLSHAGVHAAFTLVIASAFGCHYAPYLALLDGAVHFVVDRIKASPDLLGRFKALSAKEYVTEVMPFITTNRFFPSDVESAKQRLKSNTYFWWALGADQFCHHMTHYLLIYLILVLK